MIKRRYHIVCILLWICVDIASQSHAQRICFYNVENLFSVPSDSVGAEVEFSPQGLRHWHYGRYRDKLFKVGQVIANVGEWSKPTLVGLCEVENRSVLEDLINYSPLKSYQYELVHYESKYERGLDVALLYQKAHFEVIASEAIEVELQNDKGKYSRDILYVWGVIGATDSVHLFVCHFPSRRGGEMQSEKNRVYAASLLRYKVDSIQHCHGMTSKIMIMGDFNDYPDNCSMRIVLKAEGMNTQSTISPNSLYNLCDSLHRLSSIGSYKYQGQWGMLDQFIVSGSMVEGQGWVVNGHQALLFAPSWLLVKDEKQMGLKPYSTYWGRKYLGGYSDHLPIYMDLVYGP